MTIENVLSKVAVALDEIDLTYYGDKPIICIDSVQREIASLVAPIVKVCEVICVNSYITLPTLCYEVINLKKDGKYVRFTDLGNNILECEEDGTYSIKYNSYPNPITLDTPLGTELEIPNIAIEAMVYGVCAGVCINDEPSLYSAYMARYDALLDAILARCLRYPYASIKGGVIL